jgi:hypothetical protein
MAFEKIQTTYMNQGYFGPAESCTWRFTIPAPEQLAQWPADVFIAAHIYQLELQGARLLELHVSRNVAPDYTTDYLVVTVASKPEEEAAPVSQGMRLAALPLLWGIIIIGVLTAIVAIAITYAIVTLKEIPTYVSTIWGLAIGASALAAILLLDRYKKVLPG